MAVTKFLARDLTIDIFIPDSGSDSGTPASGDADWTPVKGLNTLTHAPAATDADTTDFDSMGHGEHMTAQRTDQWTIAGFTLEDVSSGARDAGQAAVEALAQAIGPVSLGWFKITSPGGNTIEFQASAVVTLADGGTNDAAKWQAVLKTSGASIFA